ncbi:MAG: T9SS type A sorting domain-containing protein, partial [Bacteroidota bacterium]
FEWEALPNATHHVFELSRLASFSVLQMDTIVAGNTFTVTNLPEGVNYYWRVRAFNSHHFCTSISERFNFRTGEVTSIQENTGSSLRIYPNILKGTTALQIGGIAPNERNIRVRVLDLNGRVVQHEQSLMVIPNAISLHLKPLPSGLYLLQVEGEKTFSTTRIVVL